jgi:hypothetical protein
VEEAIKMEVAALEVKAEDRRKRKKDLKGSTGPGVGTSQLEARMAKLEQILEKWADKFEVWDRVITQIGEANSQIEPSAILLPQPPTQLQRVRSNSETHQGPALLLLPTVTHVKKSNQEGSMATQPLASLVNVVPEKAAFVQNCSVPNNKHNHSQVCSTEADSEPKSELEFVEIDNDDDNNNDYSGRGLDSGDDDIEKKDEDDPTEGEDIYVEGNRESSRGIKDIEGLLPDSSKPKATLVNVKGSAASQGRIWSQKLPTPKCDVQVSSTEAESIREKGFCG